MTAILPEADVAVARVRDLTAQLGYPPPVGRVMVELGVDRDEALVVLDAAAGTPAPAPAPAPVTGPEPVAAAPARPVLPAVEQPSAPVLAEQFAPTVEQVEEPPAAARRRDWTTDLGILVVGLAAGVLTFSTLRDLASAVGITGTLFGWFELGWLLPIVVDAAGVVAARVWLRGRASDEAVEFARRVTLVCIVLSVVGNAGQHVMAEFAIEPPWWVVVLVTAIPPAMLGAVVHLGHLIGRHEPAG